MLYTRPSVDNLINNLPDVLKSSRQFVPWNVERGQKKVPLKADGTSWGNYNDTNCWRTFDDAIDCLDRGRAFGIGLVLPPPHVAASFPEFNLISGLVAVDGDAKRSPNATPYNVPENISGYVRSLQSYSEFSPSLKGLRSLAFGTLATEKQNIIKQFGDGTELSLYHRGWVTLSGLTLGDSPPTIEHRQEALDRLVAELGLDSNGANSPDSANAPQSAPLGTTWVDDDAFVVDWSRTANEDLIQRFIQGYNRTPRQLDAVKATWELNRGWNHGNTADNSFTPNALSKKGFGYSDFSVGHSRTWLTSSSPFVRKTNCTGASGAQESRSRMACATFRSTHANAVVGALAIPLLLLANHTHTR
jgi:hypothetical protein